MCIRDRKKIGRDRWLDLRQMLLNPAHVKVALEYVTDPRFLETAQEGRFESLHAFLKRYKTKSAAKTPKKDAGVTTWASQDESLKLAMSTKPKRVAIELTSAEARPFSEWLSSRLDRLYDEYRQTKPTNEGN